MNNHHSHNCVRTMKNDCLVISFIVRAYLLTKGDYLIKT